jgi:molybdate transport system substrate-binding protein
MKGHFRMLFLFVAIIGSVALKAQPQTGTIRIAAASDLKFAMDSIIRTFSQTHPGKIETTFGSSGKLSEQIIHGAPFDIFFSADISYPERLRVEKKTASGIYPYAKGRIVLWSAKIDPYEKQMATLNDPAIVKIAIANPMHAPYGKRAVEALQHYNLYDTVKPKLVFGENISQTAQFIASGAADIGIIALSLALSPNMIREKGNYFLIPEDSHNPLIQGAVITQHGKGNKLALSFFDFVKTDIAISILKFYGFSRP